MEATEMSWWLVTLERCIADPRLDRRRGVVQESARVSRMTWQRTRPIHRASAHESTDIQSTGVFVVRTQRLYHRGERQVSLKAVEPR